MSTDVHIDAIDARRHIDRFETWLGQLAANYDPSDSIALEIKDIADALDRLYSLLLEED